MSDELFLLTALNQMGYEVRPVSVLQGPKFPNELLHWFQSYRREGDEEATPEPSCTPVRAAPAPGP